MTLDVFSFMTTTPNALVEKVNHERMPVLLAPPEMQDQWMDGADEEAFALCKPYPPEQMRLVQAGYDKQDLGARSHDRQCCLVGRRADTIQHDQSSRR